MKPTIWVEVFLKKDERNGFRGYVKIVIPPLNMLSGGVLQIDLAVENAFRSVPAEEEKVVMQIDDHRFLYKQGTYQIIPNKRERWIVFRLYEKIGRGALREANQKGEGRVNQSIPIEMLDAEILRRLC